ncbi:hypothetical protein DXG01_001867, partial [Tephrocybe rancida]
MLSKEFGRCSSALWKKKSTVIRTPWTDRATAPSSQPMPMRRLDCNKKLGCSSQWPILSKVQFECLQAADVKPYGTRLKDIIRDISLDGQISQ